MNDWTPTLTTRAARAHAVKMQISYLGDIPVSFISSNAEYSRTNWMTRKAVKAVIGVAGFVAPLVLDSHFKIIDGQLRLEIVKELMAEGHYTATTVPVIVLDVDTRTATYLRIALNRMGEFPRWDFEAPSEDEIDHLYEFLDRHSQLQKLLEPLGFYTANLLPDSFFHDTVLSFPAKIGSPSYKREIGLVRWAEIQTKLRAEELAEKAKSPLKKPGEYTSIFFLSPREEEFIPTYNIEKEVHEFTERMKDVARDITDNYDVKRRKEKKLKGQDWQTSRRNTKQMYAYRNPEEEPT